MRAQVERVATAAQNTNHKTLTKREVHWSGYLRAGLLVGADVLWWVLGTAGLSEHSHCYWH